MHPFLFHMMLRHEVGVTPTHLSILYFCEKEIISLISDVSHKFFEDYSPIICRNFMFAMTLLELLGSMNPSTWDNKLGRH
jgi:hypothetical protein